MINKKNIAISEDIFWDLKELAAKNKESIGSQVEKIILEYLNATKTNIS